MPAPASAGEIKEVNWRYHDAAAADYDAKWGIDFGETGRRQVVGKLSKALGSRPREGQFERALEIGAGTGYFCLNLAQAGIVRSATATDISRGMLRALRDNAKRLGVKVSTERCEAERLPFDDRSFDLVFGHAVLHHLPDLDRAFAEFERVLRPGGTLAFCGEPSRYGDLIAAVPKRAARAAAPLWRWAMRAPARAPDSNGRAGGGDLELQVDVHAFAPADLRRLAADAGLRDIRVRGEELLANLSGWTTRTLEATAEPDAIPWRWRFFAFRSYLLLQRLDSALLEPRLPAQLFYNLLLSARKPT